MAPRSKSNPKADLKALIDELSNETAAATLPLFQHLVESGSDEELTDDDVGELDDEPAPRGAGKKKLAPKAAAKPTRGGGRRAAPVEDELDDEFGDDGLGDDELDDGGLEDDLDDGFEDEPAPARGRGKPVAKPAAKPAGRRRPAAVEDDFEDEPPAKPARGGRRAPAPVEDDLDDLGDEDGFGEDEDGFDDEPPAKPARRAAAPVRRRR